MGALRGGVLGLCGGSRFVKRRVWASSRVNSAPFHRLLWIPIASRAWETSVLFKAMILTAIKALKERGGSSRQAILKYVVANNKVDAAKAAGPLKLALRKALAAGTIVKAKAAGKGAGKFKAGKVEKPKKVKKVKKPKAKKPKKVKKAKKPAAKKAKKPAKKVAKK